MDVCRERFAVGEAQLSALVAGAGEPVVLLHGIPTGAELWRQFLARLAATGRRGLAPDLPGYGHTRLPRGADHSLAGAAELVARWLVAEGWAPAWVVGHDAGGAVAQILAVRHPATVSRLTLVNSIVHGTWPAPRARFATLVASARLYRLAARARLVPNPYLRAQVRRAFGDARRYDAVDTDRILWDGKFSDPEGVVAFERHLAALTPRDTAAVAPALAGLRIPCQLVWGLADPFQPWERVGRRLLALLPSPAVTLLDDCGHFVPIECQDRLLDALLEQPGSPRPSG